jgi:hypothetical protein
MLGYYLLGVASVILEEYDLNIRNTIYSGASAGAWISLMMTYRGNFTELAQDILRVSDVIIASPAKYLHNLPPHSTPGTFAPKRQQSSAVPLPTPIRVPRRPPVPWTTAAQTEMGQLSIRDFGKILQHYFLAKYSTSDFEMDRFFVGVCTLPAFCGGYSPLPFSTSCASSTSCKSSNSVIPENHHNKKRGTRRTPGDADRTPKEHSKEIVKEKNQNTDKKGGVVIMGNFTSLEDALDGCIASSHIPYITGGITRNYRGMEVMDGGFAAHPYFNPLPQQATHFQHIHIGPFMWNSQPPTAWESFALQFQLFIQLFRLREIDVYDLYEKGRNDAKKHKPMLDSLLSTTTSASPIIRANK